MVQKTYKNGKLIKTSNHFPIENLRKYLDNIQHDWESNLMTREDVLTLGFNPNNAISVNRLSQDELIIETTGNDILRFTNAAK